MYSAVFAWNVADTNALSIWKCIDVADYVFACAHRNLKIAIAVEMVIGIQEGVPDQRRPYYSG
jgi:hypothetical protein